MLDQPCNHVNIASSNYCTTCGVALVTRCQFCRETIGRSDRHCTTCGIRTPVTVVPQVRTPTARPGIYNPFLYLKVRSLPLAALLGIPVGIIAYLIATGITGLSFDSEDPVLWSIPLAVWVYGSIILWGWWLMSHHHLSIGRLVGRIPSGFPWHSIFGVVGLLLLFSISTFFLIFIPISYGLPEDVREFLQLSFFLSEAETSIPGLYKPITDSNQL